MAGNTLNANTGMAPSARVHSATASPTETNKNASSARVGTPWTRAPMGSKPTKIKARHTTRWPPSSTTVATLTSTRSMRWTTTALPNKMAARSWASCVMRSPTMTAPAPLARNTRPSRLSRVRCRRTGLAMNASVASSDATMAHSTGSNTTEGKTWALAPAS